MSIRPAILQTNETTFGDLDLETNAQQQHAEGAKLARCHQIWPFLAKYGDISHYILCCSQSYLSEADDCHGGARDHDEDAEYEKDVEDLVAEGAVRESPMRYLESQLGEACWKVTSGLDPTTNFLCLRY